MSKGNREPEFADENTSEPKKMPRLKYPDDILPDNNEYCMLDKEAIDDEIRSRGSNPRYDEHR